jgi:hypothetical protein
VADSVSVVDAWVRETRAELGLPDEIEDGAALRRLAALLLSNDGAPPKRGSSTSLPSTLPGTTPASPRGEDLDPQAY